MDSAIIFGIGVLALLALLTYRALHPPASPVVNPAYPDLLVVLERAKGSLMENSYTLTIWGNGTLTYEEDNFFPSKFKVGNSGEIKRASAAVDQAAIEKLVNAINNAGYFSLNDSYNHIDMTDQLAVYLTVQLNGRKKRVFHYLGDESAPAALTELENTIDELANTHKLAGR